MTLLHALRPPASSCVSVLPPSLTDLPHPPFLYFSCSVLQLTRGPQSVRCPRPKKNPPPGLKMTALLVAAARSDTMEVLELLRAECFDRRWLEAADVLGMTPLHWAAQNGAYRAAEALGESLCIVTAPPSISIST